MANYIFKRTDPANTSFVVQPYTVNGPATPAASTLYSNPLSGLSAVVANTSLVLAGKGVPEYGELVQNNLIYLMESFAGPTRPRNVLQGQIWYKNTSIADPSFPSDPVDLGLYIWSGTVWTPIVTSAGGGGGNLDMGGSRIVNLGNPAAAGDAISLGYADGRYVRLSGGSNVAGLTTFTNLSVVGSATFTGTPVLFDTGVHASVTEVPTAPLHIANKDYVDTEIAAAISGGTSGFLPLTGGTLTGNLSIVAPATLISIAPTVAIDIQAGSGVVTFGSRVLSSVGAPLVGTDAATKAYVDAAVIAGGGDTFLVSGALDGSGNLTLTLNTAAVVSVTGQFAQKAHVHTDSQVSYSMPLASQSYLTPTIISNFPGQYPTPTFTTVLRALDRGMYLARAPFQKVVITATTGATYTLPEQAAYVVGEGRLDVYLDRAKQIQSERGNSRIKFTGTGIGQQTLTGLSTGTYTVDFTIDGGAPFTVSATVDASGYTYRQIMNRLNFIFQGSPSAVVPATSGRVDYSWTGLTSGGSTGLTNDATVYTATITVDGTPHAISITGSAAQTFATLINEINIDLVGTATAVIQSSTNLRITSVSTGVASTVAITDTDLFSSLTGVGTPVATGGTDLVPSAPTTTVYGANARIEQYNNVLMMVIESQSQGNGSAITTSYAAGELFTLIAAGTAPVNTAVTVDRDYKEVGSIGSSSTSVLFGTSPTTGQLIEFVSHP